MSAEIQELECCICMDTINSSINNCITPCGHSFCFQCLAKALEQTNTCPCCRAVLMESPEEEDDEDTWSEYSSDDDEHEIFSDEALTSFRLFMVRTNIEIGSYDATNTSEVSEHDDMIDNEAIIVEEPVDETAEDDEVQIADVEAITAKLQGRGITMLDLVAMLTDRKSTKVAKHTDRFINAMDSILDNAIDDCDREAKEAFQNTTRIEPSANAQQKI